jgi:hypothetical protein
MFNFLFSVPGLTIILLLSFFVIVMIRHILFNRIIHILFYYTFLFIFIFMIGAVGGGGVINHAYDRLDEFCKLEENNQLIDAKNNPSNYSSMLQIDLEQFKNSNEFKAYIHEEYEPNTDKAEAISIGLLFAILAEIALLFSVSMKFATQRLWRVVCPYNKKT